MSTSRPSAFATSLNGAVEIGLRAVCLLAHAFPESCSVERLTALDYLVVHSDDVVDGPAGLHPRTPFRGGEILVRRATLQAGLTLYAGRGLVARHFLPDGIRYVATEESAAFLDSLGARYLRRLRSRAGWAVEEFGQVDDDALRELLETNVGAWGSEFIFESVLFEEDAGIPA